MWSMPPSLRKSCGTGTVIPSLTKNSLQEVDDDVRTVAASALLPVTAQLASRLTYEELAKLVDALWDCLAEGEDELGSSTGAVMDLIGKIHRLTIGSAHASVGALISHSEVIAIMADESRSSGR